MLSIRKAYKEFKNGASDITVALNHVSLELQAHDFLIVMGSNGSGKSTLFNAITGSIKLDAGDVFIDGNNVTKLDEASRAPYIARVFQNPLQGTVADFSILENFRLAALRTQSKSLKLGINQTFKDAVALKVKLLNIGLEDKLDKKVGLLSGGQRQALTVLMASMDACKLALFDEPTAALDPRSAEVVMHLIQTLFTNNGTCSILISHRIKDASAFGNKLIVMNEGVISKSFNESEKKIFKMEDMMELI